MFDFPVKHCMYGVLVRDVNTDWVEKEEFPLSSLAVVVYTAEP